MGEFMFAVVKSHHGEGGVALQQVPRPRAGVDSVIVEVHAAGVCGTDLHLLDDAYPSRPPVVLGHEVAGVVVEVGEDAEPSLLGARVACETHHQACDCTWCRSGRRNLCDNKTSMGSFVDGGFAQFVRVPSHLVHRIPDTLSLQEAALCEPLACATHLLLDPPIVNAGDRVLVTGPGPMGLLLAQVARSAGAIVTLSGLAGDAGRLVIASSMGFTVSQGSAATDYDVVLECSGTAGGARAALEAVRKGGRYVSVGIHGRDVSIPFDLVLYKELTVTSGFAATSESWRRAMSLLSRGLIDLAPMISSVWSLRHWDEVIDSLRTGQGMKILFDPRLDDAAGESGADAQ